MFVSVERIRQYVANKDQQEDLEAVAGEPKALDEEDGATPAVLFRDVSLTYEEPHDGAEPIYAIRKLNLRIEQGEKIAFCGRTGSGKTSILNILFRLYPIAAGEIYVEGRETGGLSLRELRSQMSIIPQFGFLFNATLRENIDPEGNLTREEIVREIGRSGLRIRRQQPGCSGEVARTSTRSENNG